MSHWRWYYESAANKQGVDYSLTATISEDIDLSGLLGIDHPVTATISQDIDLSGDLNISQPMSATISQQINLSGDLEVYKTLTATLTQDIDLTANLLLVQALTATVSQDIDLSGGLALDAGLTGTITEDIDLSGNLVVTQSLSSTISQDIDLSGDLTVTTADVEYALTATISQDIDLSGSLSVTNTQTLSTGDLTKLRGAKHTLDDKMLVIVQPDTVATLTVTAMPSVYPQVELTVSGDMSDVEVGMRCRVMTGTTHKTWAVVRKAPSGSTFYMTPVSLGDPGYVERIESAIAVSDTVTVYKDFPLWGVYSIIRGQVFYKAWDTSYTDQNEDPPPFANAGTWQAGKDSTSIDFVLPRGGSNTSFAFGGATISTHLWELPTGVTFKAGSASSDATPTVTATPGQHLVKYTVTDSEANTHTSFVWLFVADDSTYSSIDQAYNGAGKSAQVTSISTDLDGMEMTVEIRGADLDYDVIFPGAAVLYKETPLFDGSSLSSTSVLNDTWVGYVADMSATHDGNYGGVSLKVLGPKKYAALIQQPPQQLTEVSNPAHWQECTSSISNPRGVMSYIRWHMPNLFALHDVDANDLTTPRRQSLKFDSSNVSGALDTAAKMILGNVGTLDSGALTLRQNPNMEDNTFRNALSLVHSIGSQDVQPPLTYAKPIVQALHELRLDAFGYDGTTTVAKKARKAFAQGRGQQQAPAITLPASTILADLKEKVGHLFAAHQTQEITLAFAGNWDIFSPALMNWFRLELPSIYDPRGVGFTNTRCIVTKVTRRYDPGRNWEKTVEATFALETYGQPGVEIIVPNANSNFGDSSWAIINFPIPYEPEEGNIPTAALLWDDTGKLAITYTYTETSPIYYDLSDYFTGTVCDVCFDYNSAGFDNAAGAIGVYVVTISSTTVYVYRFTNLLDPKNTFEELTTYTMSDSSVTTEARVQCSKTNPDFAAIAFKDQTGTRIGRTRDGGTTWDSLVRAGSSVSDTANDNAPIGFVMDGDNQIVTAPDSGGDYHVYIATTETGTFSQLSGTQSNTAPNAMIASNYLASTDDALYVTTNNDGTAASPNFSNDFEGGGDTFYSKTVTIGGTGPQTYDGIQVSGGNPDGYDQWSFDGDGTASGTSNWVYAIDLGAASYTPTSFSFDMKITCSHAFAGGVYGRSHPTTTSLSSPYLINDGYGSGDVGTWKSYSWSGTGSPSQRYFYFWLSTGWGGGSGINSSATGTFQIDNVVATVSGGSTIAAKLYRVTNYSGSPTWTDITPANEEVPQYPYGLFSDPVTPNNLEAMTQEDSTKKWYSSSDNGASWTDNGAVAFRSVKRVGDVIVLSGEDDHDLGLYDQDGGAWELADKRGNLELIWGSIGTIKNVLYVQGS